MPELIQTPGTGDRLVRFVGERVRFSVSCANATPWPSGWTALLRTTLGRAAAQRAGIVGALGQERTRPAGAWRDIPMVRRGDVWELDLALAEVGYFEAKAFAVDEAGWQHWPQGDNAGLNVQPVACRRANTIYCAFPRMFGPTKGRASTMDPRQEELLKRLESEGYAVLPPSGKLRDLIRELPHIFETLGCKILHLLPIHPTPTVYARFGRFGSPYAVEDLYGIDPALVEFDRRTTASDQFGELAWEVHARGGRLFLDIVINHMGWGARWLSDHPEWFQKHADGQFASPGAWGTVWEDLVELEHHQVELRRHIADALVAWCRRGVDGFRCDAGYKVPLPVWEYVVARVREEFPDTVFLLEGLGGAWEATATLLTRGGMQWAYSELFQNHSGIQVSGYLDHALPRSRHEGLLIHYSETHDNDRLATRGRAWSLLRNRLCALTSVAGGFGFTCGVEWLAPERVNVHSSRGLAWGNRDNIVKELAALNALLADHPCFFSDATLQRVSDPGAAVYALLRIASREHEDASVLILANTSEAESADSVLPTRILDKAGLSRVCDPVNPRTLRELLGQRVPAVFVAGPGLVGFRLNPGQVVCLSCGDAVHAGYGEQWLAGRIREAWALQALSHALPPEHAAGVDLSRMGAWADRDPAGFLAAVAALPHVHAHGDAAGRDVNDLLLAGATCYPLVAEWRPADARRVLLWPKDHWLLIIDEVAFRAHLAGVHDGAATEHAASILVQAGHIACFPPRATDGVLEIHLERFGRAVEKGLTGRLLALGETPSRVDSSVELAPSVADSSIVLLTNGRGGMARIPAKLGTITSKYDCVLAANLHPQVPVDRHVLVKRMRVWALVDGFITALDGDALVDTQEGPPARLIFDAIGGNGSKVRVELVLEMPWERNTLVGRFRRPHALGAPSPSEVRLTVRLDLEDRSFHWETKRNPGAEAHFSGHTRLLVDGVGFEFTPASDRRVRAVASTGAFHLQSEWCERISHPVEQSRGQTGEGDAYSPGWFDLPLADGGEVALVINAELEEAGLGIGVVSDSREGTEPGTDRTAVGSVSGNAFENRLLNAMRAFVVRRGIGKTVVAGYPWFLDWGRDTFIAARGLLAAGWKSEVLDLVRAFGRLEHAGTLPNSLHGEDSGNRDTSDAPLWYGVVCGDLAEHLGESVLDHKVDAAGRRVADVLVAIAEGYCSGTPNGIRMDAASGLIWSPSHFTWMDTNYPAATPREGYPVEIQALWIRFLGMMERYGLPAGAESWGRLRQRATESFGRLFWAENRGWLADVLACAWGVPAASAVRDDSLRSNCLLPVAFGLTPFTVSHRVLDAARRFLVVPGALRSLSPAHAGLPLPVRGGDGRLLNDPLNPYWGRYEGDEDTRRKPAYHNGTAWTWTFPSFCEGLARTWEFTPEAVKAARSYLASAGVLMDRGCLGHLPEVVDGDAPHMQRGCDAQAWGVTETFRVWKLLASRTIAS